MTSRQFESYLLLNKTCTSINDPLSCDEKQKSNKFVKLKEFFLTTGAETRNYYMFYICITGTFYSLDKAMTSKIVP